MLHTGLRTAAVCRLRWEDVDLERGEGTVLEKNGQMRHFSIDTRLAAALAAYAPGASSRYVFPHPGNDRLPRTHHHNTRWLRRLCSECGITGDHVFVHALRRTVVIRASSPEGKW